MDQPERRTVIRRRRPPQLPIDELSAFEHNQWTFEGEIERLGSFARGMNRARRRGRRIRWVGYLVAASLLVPLLLGVTAFLVSAFAGG